jgi:hypothetical protein
VEEYEKTVGKLIVIANLTIFPLFIIGLYFPSLIGYLVIVSASYAFGDWFMSLWGKIFHSARPWKRYLPFLLGVILSAAGADYIASHYLSTITSQSVVNQSLEGSVFTTGFAFVPLMREYWESYFLKRK